MAEKRSNDLEQLRQAFARPERINDGAQLVGNALAMPLVTLRQRQARLQAIRTEQRLGAKSDEAKRRKAEAETLGRRRQQLSAEIGRQRLPKPPPGDHAGVYGRITRDGNPLPGVMVGALDGEGESRVHSCTGRDGDYILSFQPDQPTRIEVRDGDDLLFRDKSGRRYPAYRAVHRDIELSKGRPICPDDRPSRPGGYVQVPSLIGDKVDNAERTIAALGLKLGSRKAKRAAEAGVVLDQDPVPGTQVAAGSPISLIVSTADDRPAAKVGDLAGKSLSRAVAEAAKAGVGIGALNIIGDGARTPRVSESRPDASGERVDLDVSSAGGDAALTQMVATLLAGGGEATEMQLGDKTAMADWLKSRGLTNLDRIGEALAMEDGALAKRLKLRKAQSVGAARALLQAALSRVRKL